MDTSWNLYNRWIMSFTGMKRINSKGGLEQGLKEGVVPVTSGLQVLEPRLHHTLSGTGVTSSLSLLLLRVATK